MNSTRDDKLNWSEKMTAMVRSVHGCFRSIGQPLEPMAQILPQSHGVKLARHGVAVGDLRGKDAASAHLGHALGMHLRHVLEDLPALGIDFALYQPDASPYKCRCDYWDREHGVHARLDALPRVLRHARLNDLPSAVIGAIRSEGEVLWVKVRWLRVKDQKVLAEETFSAQGPQRHQRVLINLLVWTLKGLGCGLSEEQQQALQHRLPDAEIIGLARLLKKFHGRNWDALNVEAGEFLKARSPALALALLMGERATELTPKQAYRRHDVLRKRHGNHATLMAALVNRHWREEDPDIDRAVAVRMLKALDARNGNAILMAQTAQSLSKDDQHARAVALALAILRLHPRSYEAWWNLAYLLRRAAWHWRGEDLWENVDETPQNAFAELLDLACEAIEVALRIHPACPPMLAERQRHEACCSSALIDCLHRAVAIDPTHQECYEVAVHFSQPRWGGDLDTQRHVLALAMHHNPDDDWPIALWLEYLEDNDMDYALLTRLKLKLQRWYWPGWRKQLIARYAGLDQHTA